MAYEKIGWNDYDDDLSLEENIARNAVATDTLLNRMDEGIAKANNVSVTVETTDAPSVEIVDNEAGDGYTMNFGIPKGEKGDKGDAGADGADGAAATVTVGEVTTGEAGTDASVTNSGTENAAVLDFVLPKGEKGDQGEKGEQGDPGQDGADGAAATVTVGEVTTLEAGEEATVTNSGTENAAVLDFAIPKGEKGDQGDPGPAGADGAAATIEVGSVTSGDTASVKNAGTESSAVLNFVLPKGDKGDQGEKGDKGDPFSIAKTYASVDEMNEDFDDEEVAEGQFVVIATGDVNDEDNAKLYVKGAESFTFITDLSGADGLQGPAGADGAPGADGADGVAATIVVGQVTTGEAGTDATVTNSGTANAAIFDFVIPKGEKGDKGDQGDPGQDGAEGAQGPEGPQGPQGNPGAAGADGAAATVTVGEVTTLEAGEEATVTNSGTENAAVLDFAIPKGEKGDKGDPFTIKKTYASVSAMNDDFSNDDVPEGSFVMIDTGNVEDEDNAKLYVKGADAFSYITDLSGATGLKGDPGQDGAPGAAGSAATIVVGEVTTGEAGTDASVTNSGTANAAIFDFVIPKGEKGDKGDQGEQGPEGPQGPQGDPGATGADGVAATVTVGDVTTVESTEEAAVENVGTATAAILNFSIPKGEKGDSGIGKTVVEGIQLNGYTVGTKAEVFNEYSVPDISTEDTSVATPNANIATGEYSHAEGCTTKAYGNYSHAEGHYTTASGNKSHSEGFYTTASGLNSHAEGSNSIASGSSSHAEGNGSEASGIDAHAEGSGTTASGRSSHSEGYHTIASGYFQHVQGQYNIEDADGLYAHIVGWGSRDSKKNIHTITTTGDGWFAGKLSAGTPESPANPTEANDLITKKYFEDNSTAGLTGEATSIEAIAEPTTASTSDIATKVNEIIAALKARGVVL